MIPEFDGRGYLPPGVHEATLEEVIERFGKSSPTRRDEAESLEWLIPLCRAAGIRRLIVNGSFVTGEPDP